MTEPIEDTEDASIRVTDVNFPSLRGMFIGRTIVGFEREPYSGEEWGMHENSVAVILDDGSVLSFLGIGYDSSALVTRYTPAPDKEG